MKKNLYISPFKFSTFPFRLVPIKQQGAKVLEMIKASHLLVELRVHRNVKIIINFLNLSQVLVLHLSPGSALSTWV